ncbi:GyrI-like domain-containing protein [Enterococcus timonensis]|uniref:GyrI-like domain-containing protein n=1 Tax=Enterococcus timonensis TaxID=1852364 RepID=UPI0008D920B5|nr:GyrI-like domain-containing protein [Enterococcus timonensis]
MEKYEWRKSEPWYKAVKKPQILNIPAQNFLSIHGLGDPNEADFKERVATLYPVAYQIRMSEKNGFAIPGFFPFTVYPLMGFWTIQEKYFGAAEIKKDFFEYDLMIQQPDFVTPEIMKQAIERATAKISETLAKELIFKKEPAQIVGQILHLGPYDNEAESFATLEIFLKENGYRRVGKTHQEIYLSDPRRSAPEKQKTLLRVAIEKI